MGGRPANCFCLRDTNDLLGGWVKLYNPVPDIQDYHPGAQTIDNGAMGNVPAAETKSTSP